MPQDIKVIRLSLPYRLGTANCYLVETRSGYVLIDTGGSNGRTTLEKELESAGCRPGGLDLIILTHGDFDHIGNAAYLGKKHGARIAMHRRDSGMAEHGDMSWNRRKGNVLFRMAARILPTLFGFGKAERFKPDLPLEDEQDLSEYGLEAQVVRTPGHSKGSISILTADGDLFCGDLLENTGKPALNAIMDDLTAANASAQRLKSLEIRTFYPGHGEPFPVERFGEYYRNSMEEV